ncbi:hypothetical protein O6H91_16G040800 [Diphasiastrum complanatum]|uniref:Uncharacterized protein n=1 Tax=Diphasiastrum complanatum TaxID=34168 RepID=A0ACC2BBR5_DIPCM|nr:hypothetical protein O6H91_16G040800 [Diphasiastrum complanatum]
MPRINSSRLDFFDYFLSNLLEGEVVHKLLTLADCNIRLLMILHKCLQWWIFIFYFCREWFHVDYGVGMCESVVSHTVVGWKFCSTPCVNLSSIDVFYFFFSPDVLEEGEVVHKLLIL